jgi:coenzyme F420-0:L-glutamate ligase/coenzyme F420-1:gamma-L-glutamate ligase
MQHPPSHPETTWNQLSRIVKSRRSYKQPFAGDAISPATIEACLELARWAPSAHNAQPWRFMPFYWQDAGQQAIRARLIDAMGEKYGVDLARDGMAKEQVERSTKARNQRFLDAPVLVLAFVDELAIDTHADESRMAAERIMGTQSLAAALQTFLLALHAAGLDACWYCAPLFASNVVREVLKVPDSWHAQAFIATGVGTNKKTSEQRFDGRMPATARQLVSEITCAPDRFLKEGEGASR